MQKVVITSSRLSGTSGSLVTQNLDQLNSFLDDGWKILENKIMSEYMVLFILEKRNNKTE